MEFNENIRALREDNDQTQEQIAKIMKTTQRRISRLETGFTQPTIEDIKKYCQYYHVTADWLLNVTVPAEPALKKITNDQ